MHYLGSPAFPFLRWNEGICTYGRSLTVPGTIQLFMSSQNKKRGSCRSLILHDTEWGEGAGGVVAQVLKLAAKSSAEAESNRTWRCIFRSFRCTWEDIISMLHEKLMRPHLSSLHSSGHLIIRRIVQRWKWERAEGNPHDTGTGAPEPLRAARETRSGLFRGGRERGGGATSEMNQVKK